MSTRTLSRRLVSLTLTVGMLLSAVAHAARDLPDFTRLVESQGRTVVNISTTQTVKTVAGPFGDDAANDLFSEFFRRFGVPGGGQPREQQQSSLGSGFLISADGYIMTNAHVVAKADEITVSTTDKREYKAKLVGADTRTDVAVLKIDGHSLPTVSLGNPSLLKPGEWVVAIGSPFGFDNSVTAGIVSAKGRQLPGDAYVPFIQTDVAVNPGNSGGPLFNLDGQVVGINSQIYSRSGGFMGISFAIPIDVAMQVADQLKAHGRVSRAVIGVSVQELSRDLAASFGLSRPSGALINSVQPGGPADKAGLKSGDIVLQVGGKPVENASDMARLISSARPGQPLALEIWRNKASRTLTVTPNEMSEQASERQGRNRQPNATPALTGLNMSLSELSPAQLRALRISYGLMVQRVQGLAARAGVQPGDVIVGVNNSTLTSAEQFREQVAAAKAGDTLALRLIRDGNTLFVAVPVAEK